MSDPAVWLIVGLLFVERWWWVILIGIVAFWDARYLVEKQMTDPLETFRKAVADATPGRWHVGQSAPGPVWLYAERVHRDISPIKGQLIPETKREIARIGELAFSAHEQEDAQHIINADRLARFIPASEEAPTVIADTVEKIMFALALVRRLEGNTRGASQDVARAILTELANRALPQEAKDD